jgi:DNA-binding transcriptional LysR family regulator
MPDYRAAEFTISAIYPNRSHLPAKVRLFIDLLRRVCLASQVDDMSDLPRT